ncbi:hypothetical protein GCM10007350_33030 [Jeongeupia chitinilytica]|uniref:Uncharacterized protein n=1 Tax=Jeongeupia chitinilytica TaxID=1041641 RepID=A0ABQ3H581_9NEIS|nr:hypothetical protein GCM10007350_33030 [Jeongeupia chitinilytica]
MRDRRRLPPDPVTQRPGTRTAFRGYCLPTGCHAERKHFYPLARFGAPPGKWRFRLRHAAPDCLPDRTKRSFAGADRIRAPCRPAHRQTPGSGVHPASPARPPDCAGHDIGRNPAPGMHISTLKESMKIVNQKKHM